MTGKKIVRGLREAVAHAKRRERMFSVWISDDLLRLLENCPRGGALTLRTDYGGRDDSKADSYGTLTLVAPKRTRRKP